MKLFWLLIASSLSAAPAAAQTPAKPRAAVALTAAPDTDSFVQAYLFEVAATVLRAQGFEVAPPNAARALLAADGSTAVECARDDECVRELAAALGTPMVLFAHAAPQADDDVTVEAVAATVVLDGVERSDAVDHAGDESAVAERIQAVAAALGERPRPCQLDVSARGALDLVVRVDGAASTTRFPLFVPAGVHQLTVSGRDRQSWSGTFECAPGRRYRMHVR